MADIKISGLPAAASAAASDQHEVNQGGVSKRLTNAQIAVYVASIDPFPFVGVVTIGSGITLNPDGSAAFGTGIFANAGGTFSAQNLLVSSLLSLNGGVSELHDDGGVIFSSGKFTLDSIGTLISQGAATFGGDIITGGSGTAGNFAIKNSTDDLIFVANSDSQTLQVNGTVNLGGPIGNGFLQLNNSSNFLTADINGTDGSARLVSNLITIDGSGITLGDPGSVFDPSQLSGNGGLVIAAGNASIEPTGLASFKGVTVFGTEGLTVGGGAGAAISKILSASATLNFGSTAAGASTDLTITVTGAVDGDPVFLGVPNGSTLANGVFTAWVSAADTVKVRFTNTNLLAALDPASGTFRVAVFHF